MAKIKPIPAMFKTTDGSEYRDEKDAAAHQELLDATEELSRARRRFEAATVNERRTADGVLFDLTRWDDYYAVRQRHRQEPYIQPVKFWYDTTFRLYGYGGKNDQLQIVVFDRDEKQTAEFFINELYAYRENAVVALAEAMEKYIAWMSDDLAKMKAGTWRC